MEGPTSCWGLRNRITLLTLQEHDDDDDDLIRRQYEFIYMSFVNKLSVAEICSRGCLLEEFTEEQFWRKIWQSAYINIMKYIPLHSTPYLMTLNYCPSTYSRLVSADHDSQFHKECSKTPFTVSLVCLWTAWILSVHRQFGEAADARELIFDGMRVTEENWATGRESCPCATSSTTQSYGLIWDRNQV